LIAEIAVETGISPLDLAADSTMLVTIADVIKDRNEQRKRKR
jgi:hypothetical protein